MAPLLDFCSSSVTEGLLLSTHIVFISTVNFDIYDCSYDPLTLAELRSFHVHMNHCKYYGAVGRA